MMMDILEKQQIRRRSGGASSTGGKAGFKYNSNAGMLGNQNPVHVRRRHTRKSAGAGRKAFRFPGAALKQRNSSEKAVNSGYQAAQKPRPKSSGFSFKVPSLMSVLVVAGIILFSLVALHWKFPSELSLNMNSDGLAERNLASYAGVPSLDVPVPDQDIPLDLMESFEWKTYKVQSGDSVFKIARDFGISMDAIIASNNISNARRLSAGMVLRIPNIDGIPYTVKKGDTLSRISASMNVPLEVILDVNDIRSDTITPGQVLFMPGARMPNDALKLALGEQFIYPIKGRLTDSYGFRNDPFTNVRAFHAAVDLAAPIGVPIKAAMDGKVAYVGNSASYGKFVILSHAGGYQTLYAHMSVIAVKQGDTVIQGNKIGEVGTTGKSTGPHLHFAIYKNNKPVNPLDFLH